MGDRGGADRGSSVGPAVVGWLKYLTGSFSAGLPGMGALPSLSAVLAWTPRMVVRHEQIFVRRDRAWRSTRYSRQLERRGAVAHTGLGPVRCRREKD